VRALLLVAAFAVVAAGCGRSAPPREAPVVLRPGDLSGWDAVRAAPGIGSLAPDLSGLRPAAETDAPTLVRAGDAVRATTFLFESAAAAAEVLARSRRSPYAGFLRHAFRTDPVAVRDGYRLRVPRQAEPGSDTVELYLLRAGRAVAVVELLSSSGFDRRTRERVLALARSRLEPDS
jgi:hypothetical protein